MKLELNPSELTQFGLNQEEATLFSQKITNLTTNYQTPETAWPAISQTLSQIPFPLHLFLFKQLFPKWPNHPDSAPAWIPTTDFLKTTHLYQAMQAMQLNDVKDFHRFTLSHMETFWQYTLNKLNIVFHQAPEKILDLSKGPKTPTWLPGAKLNIVESCFTANPHATAIFQDKNGEITELSYEALNTLSNRVANGLMQQGFKAGDVIGIIMSMDYFAVAIYLGIIKLGGVVVSIADSFSQEEMLLRLKISKAKGLFTQDVVTWSGKILPLYEKIIANNKPELANLKMIVLSNEKQASASLRPQDLSWKDFLSTDEKYKASAVDAMSPCHILFSSGTTAEPKAIVWNHSTPLKVASDAYFHHNIEAGDVLAWPTNLGWMMGPWLIFAALINQASIALYPDAPKDRAFGEFLERAKVTMLGVVPTLVAAWRQSHCMEGLHWQHIKCFSSSGECSNAEDMFYLMSLANYKPIIEYCGGTEIGGAYVSSTLMQANYPSLFSTPTMGSDFTIIDEEGHEAKEGEVALIPPALGLSSTLLNADHGEVYYANMPHLPDGRLLRRHGDQIKQCKNGYYAVLGRVDDTMNLGGIKTSAAEIERALAGLPEILEVAAIAISPPGNGPQQLVIYAATEVSHLNKTTILKDMQKRINLHLNPLFKIHDLIFLSDLPKTASNKIMRRSLRKAYSSHTS